MIKHIFVGSFSSSDSDSDPEGGEIPEISHPKIVHAPKKKQKKRRSEKAIEDRVEKLHRKRQVNFPLFTIFFEVLKRFSL